MSEVKVAWKFGKFDIKALILFPEMLSNIAPNPGKFVENRLQVPRIHIEKELLLSRYLTALVSHARAISCSGYLASWIVGEPHSVVLADGKHPHRQPRCTMFGYRR